MPLDWELTDPLRSFAVGKGLDAQAIAEELEKFRDHEFRDAKSDWPACWRTWVRNAVKYRERDGRFAGNGARGARTAAEVSMDNLAELRREILGDDQG